MASTIVLTGAAGFIGSHLATALLERGDRVVGFDNFNDFYDPAIKRLNAKRLGDVGGDRFVMIEGDLRSEADLERLFDAADGPFVLVHLAAMAGVRPSVEDPLLYQDVNISGTYRLLEAARRREITHYVFGSSSSVYGSSEDLPFSEDLDNLDPRSPYAATKLLGEQIGYVYHECHGWSATCLRFFTVYGPRQRPEMAIHQFARAIQSGAQITLFGDGSTTRDYTYADDIVSGVVAAIDRPLGYEIINLGGGNRVTLLEMVRHLEDAIDRKAVVEFAAMHPGDMRHTLADVSKAKRLLDYAPRHAFADGIVEFAKWFREAGETSAR